MSFPSFYVICILAYTYLSSNNVRAFMNLYPKIKDFPVSGEDAGNALFLTPLIESGKIEEAREKATVSHKKLSDYTSYAGYLTVNKNYNSNMFFWFFPAQQNPKDAPVVLWLQGGPGASSMYGLFLENGPFSVTPNKTLKAREYSWTTMHNMIYIDNPVGTGYSFTDDTKGYAKNETDVGRDLHTALVQFFQLFTELRKNPFFATGESYGGKYVPAISHAIKDYNMKAETKINIQGLAIGNGFTDPINQLNYGDYLYQLGLLDLQGRNEFRKYEAKARKLINDGNFMGACDLFDLVLNNDMSKGPSMFTNLTGFVNYFNYLHPEALDDAQYMSEWIQTPDVRKALHVGNASFHAEDKTVELHLKMDIMQSMAVLVKDLLKHYRVMHYNGQLDIIVAYPLTENYLQNLNWTGAEKYKTAKRKIWRVDNEIAGYTKTVDNLTEVLVRNAGHMVPADQPKWALDLITRFTHGKKF